MTNAFVSRYSPAAIFTGCTASCPRHLHVAQSVCREVDAQYLAPLPPRCRTVEPSAGCPATKDSPCRSPASRRASAETRRASGCPQRPVTKTTTNGLDVTRLDVIRLDLPGRLGMSGRVLWSANDTFNVELRWSIYDSNSRRRSFIFFGH